MYNKNTWKDRVVQYPNRYKDQSNNQLTFTPDPGTVTEAGTPFNAQRMNNIETGIADAHTDIALLKGKSLVDMSGNTYWAGNKTPTYAQYLDATSDIMYLCSLPYDYFSRPIQRRQSFTQISVNFRHYHGNGFGTHSHNLTLTIGYRINGGNWVYVNKAFTTGSAGGSSSSESFVRVDIPLSIVTTRITDYVEFNIQLSGDAMSGSAEYRDIWFYSTVYFE